MINAHTFSPFCFGATVGGTDESRSPLRPLGAALQDTLVTPPVTLSLTVCRRERCTQSGASANGWRFRVSYTRTTDARGEREFVVRNISISFLLNLSFLNFDFFFVFFVFLLFLKSVHTGSVSTHSDIGHIIYTNIATIDRWPGVFGEVGNHTFLLFFFPFPQNILVVFYRFNLFSTIYLFFFTLLSDINKYNIYILSYS